MPPKVRRKTRQKSGELGAPSELPDVGALPTNKEIIASVESDLDKNDASGHPKHRAQLEKGAYARVRDALIKKHLDVNPKLALIPEKKIDEKINHLHQQSKKAKRNNLRGKEEKIFHEKFLRLFDIIACKCEIINCGGGPACRRMHWLPCAVKMSS